LPGLRLRKLKTVRRQFAGAKSQFKIGIANSTTAFIFGNQFRVAAPQHLAANSQLRIEIISRYPIARLQASAGISTSNSAKLASKHNLSDFVIALNWPWISALGTSRNSE